MRNLWIFLAGVVLVACDFGIAFIVTLVTPLSLTEAMIGLMILADFLDRRLK